MKFAYLFQLLHLSFLQSEIKGNKELTPEHFAELERVGQEQTAKIAELTNQIETTNATHTAEIESIKATHTAQVETLTAELAQWKAKSEEYGAQPGVMPTKINADANNQSEQFQKTELEQNLESQPHNIEAKKIREKRLKNQPTK